MEEINFRYSISEKDFMEFTFWFLFKKTRFRGTLMIALSIALFSFVVLYLMNELDWVIFMVIFSMYIFIGVILPLIFYLRIKRNYRKNPSISLETQYTLNREGFSMKNEATATQVKWEDVHQVLSNNHFIFILTGPNVALIFPIRLLKKYELDFFKSLIVEKIPNDKINLKLN